MFTAASAKLTAQWASQRCSQVVANTVSRIPTTTVPLPPIIVITVAGRRCWQAPMASYRRFSSSTDVVNERIHKNVARLYARRVLEIAAASAAVQRFIAELESPAAAAAAATAKPPSDWHNWQRREWSQELLESLGGNKLTRLWAATKRLASLACLAAPLTVLYPLSLVSNKAEEVSWRYALWGIENAGPTFTKLVQWASTRQDLFSPEFCHYFGKLQDKTKGHSWDETVKILQEELGLPELKNSPEGATTAVNEYLDLDHTPIGSGCIAQVYRGTLKQAVGQYDKGTEVAVKVQHPGIWHKVCVDFYILGLAARWLEGLPFLNLKFLSLSDTVQKFRDIMLPQLDLTLESKHLQRFNRDFSNSKEVTFPRPINELTNTRVLTETFQHGKPILKYTDAPEAVRKEIAYNGLETTLKMIFLNDFLHGDLHPGNILVRRNSSLAGNPLQLCLLDCGLVVEMGPEQHVNLVKILGAFTKRDGRLAGQLMVDSASESQASALDIELFVKGIEKIVIDDENNNFIEKVGDYITDICYMACLRKVKLESSFISAALAVEIMEGIATSLYPKMQVTKVALPLVLQAEAMHRLSKLSFW